MSESFHRPSGPEHHYPGHGQAEPITNRLPVGPGSRGGRYHEPAYRLAWHRAWRAGNPEYREREALRRARQRARATGQDPADIVVPATYPRPLPVAAVRCICSCGCNCEVPVVACGMCLTGLHDDD